MRARRYTVILADRSNGLVRRFTISLRPVISVCLSLAVLPILMGLGAKWKAEYDIDQLRTANAALEIENASYRAATGELTAQIQSLEGVVDDLGARSTLDPAAARAMQSIARPSTTGVTRSIPTLNSRPMSYRRCERSARAETSRSSHALVGGRPARHPPDVVIF